MAGTNLLINLLIFILRILTSLGLFFNHEIFCRLLGLPDVCNNGKTVPGEYPISYFLNQLEDYETGRKVNNDQLHWSPCEN